MIAFGDWDQKMKKREEIEVRREHRTENSSERKAGRSCTGCKGRFGLSFECSWTSVVAGSFV